MWWFQVNSRGTQPYMYTTSEESSPSPLCAVFSSAKKPGQLI